MTKPLIQTDDIGTTREMTDEEYANYEAVLAEYQPLVSPE